MNALSKDAAPDSCRAARELNALLLDNVRPDKPTSEAVLDRCLHVISRCGLRALGNGREGTVLKATATRLLRECSACLDPAMAHVLSQLARAGDKPVYDNFIGLGLLNVPLPRLYEYEDAAYPLARLVCVLAELRSREEKLGGCSPHRLRYVVEAVEQVGSIGVCLPTLDARLARYSVLPQSSHPEEQMFIAVVQALELTFAAAVEMERAAICGLAHDFGSSGERALEILSRIVALLPRILRILSTMKVEDWQAFREFTLPASAEQSEPWRLMERLFERPDGEARAFAEIYLGRELDRPTLLELASSSCQSAKLTPLVLECGRRILAFYDGHLGLTRHFNASLSQGIEHLEWRRQHFLPATRELIASQRRPPVFEPSHRVESRRALALVEA